MALDLHFSKSDSNTSWGFRLTGGADFGLPLIVVKVTENSLAELSGLKVDDIIVRINETPAAGLTHNQAHDILHEAGNEFVLGVRRGDDIADLFTKAANDIQANTEVSEILKEAIAQEEVLRNTFIIEPPIAIKLQENTQNQTLPELSPSQNLAGQEEIVNNNNVVNGQPNIDIATQKKWSTFLQKPKNRPPVPKAVIEEQSKKGAPYRVVIKKQKKKTEEEKRLELEEKTATLSESRTEEDTQSEEIIESGEMASCDNPELVGVEVEVTATICDETTIEETEVNESQDEEDEKSVMLDSEQASLKRKSIPLNIKFDEVPNVESTISLEEQLAQVQKQLLALAQLPSAIQDTLDAVTQQLAKIVTIKQSSEERETEQPEAGTTTEDDITEPLTTEEILDGENGLNTDNDEDEQNEKNNNVDEEEQNGEVNGENNKDDEPVEEVVEETEEEKLARKIAEEKLAKQQKEMEKEEEFLQRRLEQRPTLPLKPMQRPIILPGGRRWSEPDDACPKIRNPKMSDEKIANTIETFSEVLVGKAKGINFLKYQPPPKNLDYLQRSEVYRLIHDMEPPVRGISTRAEKILSAQDYYEPKDSS